MLASGIRIEGEQQDADQQQREPIHGDEDPFAGRLIEVLGNEVGRER
jgi:hypothetical protein